MLQCHAVIGSHSLPREAATRFGGGTQTESARIVMNELKFPMLLYAPGTLLSVVL